MDCSGKCLVCDEEAIPSCYGPGPLSARGKTLELYEVLCRYFNLSATERPTSIENMTLFCIRCLQTVREMLRLHKDKVQLDKMIGEKVKIIKKSVQDVKDKRMRGKKASFHQSFRDKVRCQSVSVTLNRLEDKSLPKKKDRNAVICGEVDLKIVKQEESDFFQIDGNEEESFVQEEERVVKSENNLPMEIDPIDFLELTDNDYEEDDDPQGPSSKRSLRPRRNNTTFYGNTSIQKIDKEEYEEDEDPLALSDNDNASEVEQSDGNVDLESESSSEEEEESNSKSDVDWKSRKPRIRAPRVRKRTAANPKIDQEKLLYIKDKVELKENGNYLFKQFEFSKVETESGFRISCLSCNYDLILGEHQEHEDPYFRIKKHIHTAHFGAFTCTICSKTFASKKSVNRHIVLRHNTKEPRSMCEFCGKPFKSRHKKFLETHHWSHKSEEEKELAIKGGAKAPMTHRDKVEASKLRNPERYPCTKCDLVFSWKSHFLKHFARKHEKGHKNNLECQKCSITFLSVSDLNIHKLKVCEKDSLLQYNCFICDKRFPSKKECSRHESKHQKPFKCSKCSESFVSELILNSHLQKCDGTKAQSEPIFFEGFQYVEEEDDTGTILRCSTCPFIVEHIKHKHDKCESNRKMHVHIRGRHAGTYKCNICGKQLSEPKSLRNHIQSHNNNEPQEKCSICEKPFKSLPKNRPFFKAHMWSHLNEEEKAERIANGEMAPLTYSDRLQLTKKAKNISQGIFQCHLCGKTFPWESNLKKHERTHQVKEGLQAKTFQCSSCGKFYASQDYLNSHIKHVHERDKLHTWHYCTTPGCSRKFSQLNGLRKHERSHERERLRDQTGAAAPRKRRAPNNNKASGSNKKSRQKRKNYDDYDHSSASSSEEDWKCESERSTGQLSVPIPRSMMQINQFVPSLNSVPHFSSNNPSSSSSSLQPNQRFYEDGNVYHQNFFN